MWHTRPDGSVALPPAGAAVADADDPGEDDVDMLQVRYLLLGSFSVHACYSVQAVFGETAVARPALVAGHTH